MEGFGVTKAEDERAAEQSRRLVLLLSQLAMGFKNVMGAAPAEGFPAGRPSLRQLAALMSLAQGGPASVTELAARLQLTLTHASQIVGELATSGLVERREDPRDRRRTIVSVAPVSRDLVDAATASAARPVAAFCAALSKREADQFLEHVATLVSFLDRPAPR